MRKYPFLLTALIFGILFTSCGGDPSRDEAHEEVVQKEREEGDALLGVQNTEEQLDQRAQRIEIKARDFQYNPSQIRVQAGEQLSIRLINNGQTEHNIEFELPEGEEKLEKNLQPDERGTLEFTAPQEQGTYPFYCPVSDHRERGMTGELIVE